MCKYPMSVTISAQFFHEVIGSFDGDNIGRGPIQIKPYRNLGGTGTKFLYTAFSDLRINFKDPPPPVFKTVIVHKTIL